MKKGNGGGDGRRQESGLVFRPLERRLCLWLNTNFGCAIDPDDPATFASALSDGVVLCKLGQALSGNRSVKFKSNKPNAFQINENVTAFAQQCKSMGLADVCTLSPSDVRAGSAAKIMGCLMRIYNLSRTGKLHITTTTTTKPTLDFALRRAELSKDARAAAVVERMQRARARCGSGGGGAAARNISSSGAASLPMTVSGPGGIEEVVGHPIFNLPDLESLGQEDLEAKLREVAAECARLQGELKVRADAGESVLPSLLMPDSTLQATAQGAGRGLAVVGNVPRTKRVMILLLQQSLLKCSQYQQELHRAECQVAATRQPAEDDLKVAPMPQLDAGGLDKEPPSKSHDPDDAPDDDGDAADDIDDDDDDLGVLDRAKAQLDEIVDQLQAKVQARSSDLGALIAAGDFAEPGHDENEQRFGSSFLRLRARLE